MTPKIPASSRRIRATTITPRDFAPFGTVIQNPTTHGGQPANVHSTSANQGSAIKLRDVTDLRSFYERSASGKPAAVSTSLFTCKPRRLRDGKLFDVAILERHPFTSQTFVPMGLDAADPDTCYLVVVAPTLPLKSRTVTGSGESPPPPPYPLPARRRRRGLRQRLLGARPNPFTNDFAPSTTPSASGTAATAEQQPRGPGAPDLANLKAFIVRGDQAVTYGPGTWHAPMVVLGAREVDFFVVQFANSVGVEDCQEVELVSDGEDGGLAVELDGVIGSSAGPLKAKL